jgi:Ca2+-binding RTX toxin-like protein
MATFNIYHGFPGFDPGAVFVDALLNGSIFSSDASNVVFKAADGATIDFTGSFVPGIPPTGTVTGFEVFPSGLTTQPPLITATGYDFDLDTALLVDLPVYRLGNPALFNALFNVPTTYNGSPDADFIVDITSLGSRIYGNAGNDTEIGGSGKDLLWGGPGADHFDFLSVTDSVVGPHRDIIEDFSHAEGDKIGLALIDANTRVPGDQAFRFIGSDTFAHYHSLHHSVLGMVRFSHGIVQGNVNANLAPDFEIAVKGVATLTAHDFIL